MQNNTVNISYIGYLKTNFTGKEKIPRQGKFSPETKAQIVLNKEYSDGLKDLEKFEYIWVIFIFDRRKEMKLQLKPPESQKIFGVFATRSPLRPNPVGMTLVKIEKIEDNIIHIKGTDALDNTPVIDIKPYIKEIDCINSDTNRQIKEILKRKDHNTM